MAFNVSEAAAATKAAAWLIENFHPDLAEHGVQIRCRFRDDQPVSQGRELRSGTKILRGFEAYEAQGESGGVVVILWFALPAWKVLSTRDRLALVDAALCGVGAAQDKNGHVAVRKRPPTAMVYAENLGRFGAWWGHAALAVKKAQEAQLGLPYDELGSLDAQVTDEQAETVFRGPASRVGATVFGTGSIEPGDLDSQGESLEELEAGATDPTTAEVEVLQAAADELRTELVPEPDLAGAAAKAEVDAKLDAMAALKERAAALGLPVGRNGGETMSLGAEGWDEQRKIKRRRRTQGDAPPAVEAA